MAIRSVALVGGNGVLGSKILEGLVSAGCFDVTVVKRVSSASATPPNSVHVVQVPDGLPFQDLAEALRGQDAVISCFRLHDPDQHLRLAEAAAAAGVRRFIPADFGSCDATSPSAQKFLKLYRDKERVRRRAEELAEEYDTFSWTSLVCGHFFDWGLHDGLLHIDLKTRKALLLDGGNVKASASTLHRIAEATVRVLQRDDLTKNKVLYVQSFCVSQRDILTALEKATSERWDITDVRSDEFISERKERAAAGDPQNVEELVFALGTVDANWETRDGFAMKLLGLQNESLDDVVARVLSEI